eukprot:PhF_6_TR43416/c0_g1_i1/m.66700
MLLRQHQQQQQPHQQRHQQQPQPTSQLISQPPPQDPPRHPQHPHQHLLSSTQSHPTPILLLVDLCTPSASLLPNPKFSATRKFSSYFQTEQRMWKSHTHTNTSQNAVLKLTLVA